MKAAVLALAASACPAIARPSTFPGFPWVSSGACTNAAGDEGPCMPGREFCGQPFKDAAKYHLMDQHGCAENDPNGPVFDPVHGVIHHFYQIHLAAPPGHGPNYGHFVSKDFVHWAALPVAIWNGFDSSVTPVKMTPYDNEAIFTGSGVVVDGAGPGGKGPGIVQIYPGLCNKSDWPQCDTGTLLAQAVPADYEKDVLLTNWTKPSYNPIMENTQRDPSTPWKLPNGEWRMRNFEKLYGTASDSDLLAGKWYELGASEDFRRCECPSFYPLPDPSPGFEAEYASHSAAGTLPTHVHKTSCSGDWWQIGTYDAGAPKTTGSFKATPGWEDLYEQKKIDAGHYYASKDNEYPTKDGNKRRINWGWLMVPPASTQSLPREITFNAAARTLQQAPIKEVEGLRDVAAFEKSGISVDAGESFNLNLAAGVTQHSEVIATFELPTTAAVFGIKIGHLNMDSWQPNLFGDQWQLCEVNYTLPSSDAVSFYEVPVKCNGVQDTLRLLPSEKTLELRIFADATFLETFFQGGRVAMTVINALDAQSSVEITSSAPVNVQRIAVYPMRSIWVSPDEVRNQARVYPSSRRIFV